jgi:phage gp46-like protein
MTTTVDLKLIRDQQFLYDLLIKSNGDLDVVDSFDTSLTVSLLGERRADASEVPDAPRRRGWWGNEVNDNIEFELGSKLWIVLAQSRKTSENLRRAISYAREALQWLIDDGYLRDIQVSGEFTTIGLRLEIILLRDQSVAETRYYDLWTNTGEIVT